MFNMFGGSSAQWDGAMFKTLVLFAFVVTASAILDLVDAVTRDTDDLGELSTTEASIS